MQDPAAPATVLSRPARRTERVLGAVRLFTGVWAVFLVLTYPDFPAGQEEAIQQLCLLLLAGFLVGSAVIWLALELPHVRHDAQRAAMTGLVLDSVTTTAIAFAFGFDRTSAVWIILFLLPVEGAMRFQLRGAAATLALSVAGYVGREYAWSAWGQEPPDWRSIIFRMTVVGIVTVFVGLISEQLRAEREIARAALERVQRSEQWRSRLVAALGHDVRSPLATMQMQARALAEMDLTEEQRTSMLRGLGRQARQLQTLAEGLLDLAQAEEAQLELRRRDVDVAELVAVGIELSGLTEAAVVEVEPGLTVHADPDRLAQVVLNLVSNARKYGEPPVEVRARAVDGRLRLEVRDHGPGIPAELAADLFTPWGRGGGEHAVGLGLFLVRAIVEAHGGTVTAEDAAPGARLVVVLPGLLGADAAGGESLETAGNGVG